MIFLNTGTQPRHTLQAGPHAAAQAAHAIWIDLQDPTDEERAVIEKAAGLRIPSKAELSEIESSSRLSMRDGVLTLSTPMVSRADGADPTVFPLGFVVSDHRLVTVRYADLRAFDVFADRLRDQPDTAPAGDGFAVFVGLLEALVDRLADVLEAVGAELDAYSRQIFRPEITAGSGNRRADAVLRDVLRGIGRAGELISKLRDSLLGVGRITGYVMEIAKHQITAEAETRLRTLRADLQSLNDYDSQVSNKVQFLLDATLGFINIQQNNIMKVLTVASIVGIPPTLIAGIYGMNFQDIPEYKWVHGYPYSLVLMAVSGLLPLLWFRRRGWL